MTYILIPSVVRINHSHKRPPPLLGPMSEKFSENTRHRRNNAKATFRKCLRKYNRRNISPTRWGKTRQLCWRFASCLPYEIWRKTFAHSDYTFEIPRISLHSVHTSIINHRLAVQRTVFSATRHVADHLRRWTVSWTVEPEFSGRLPAFNSSNAFEYITSPVTTDDLTVAWRQSLRK